MDERVRIGTAHRRAPRPPHPSRSYPGDERRKLPARDQQEGATPTNSRAANPRAGKPRAQCSHEDNQPRRRRTVTKSPPHASSRATLRSARLDACDTTTHKGSCSPFLSTRLVHFYAAIWHNLSPPLTQIAAAPVADFVTTAHSDSLKPEKTGHQELST